MSAFAIGLYNIRDASWRPTYREVVDKLIQFPSMERARYNEPEYAPMKRLRQAGSRLNLLLVEGSA